MLASDLRCMHDSGSRKDNTIDRRTEESEDDREDVFASNNADRLHVQRKSYLQQSSIHDAECRVHSDAEGKSRKE